MVSPVRIRVPPLKKSCKSRKKVEGVERWRGGPYSSRTQPRLVEGVVHRARRRVTHAGQDVRVGVEGDGYGGVAEKFLDDLGVTPRSSKRGARVPQVVEPDPATPPF